MFNKLYISFIDNKITILQGYYRKHIFHVKNIKSFHSEEILEKKIEKIKEFIIDSSIKSKKANIIISSPRIIVKTIDCHVKGKKNIQSFIEFELKDNIPLNTTYSIKYRKIKGTTKYIAIACPSDIIQFYEKICIDLNLKRYSLDIGSHTILSLYEKLNTEETLAFVNITKEHEYINILDSQYILFNIASKLHTEKISKYKDILNFYKDKEDKEIDKVILIEEDILWPNDNVSTKTNPSNEHKRCMNLSFEDIYTCNYIEILGAMI